jgi:hypothetical protein
MLMQQISGSDFAAQGINQTEKQKVMIMITEMTDDEVFYFITEVRKFSLRRDLWRHRFLKIRILFGLSRRYHASDLPGIEIWITTIKRIMNARKILQ